MWVRSQCLCPFIPFFSWRIPPSLLLCSLFSVSVTQIQPSCRSWDSWPLHIPFWLPLREWPGMNLLLQTHPGVISRHIPEDFSQEQNDVNLLCHPPRVELSKHFTLYTHSCGCVFWNEESRFKFMFSYCILLRTENFIFRLNLPLSTTQRQCCSDFR